METAKAKVVIKTPNGLITKKACLIVMQAQRFVSDIRISTNNSNYECAKNLFCLQKLDLTVGNELIIVAKGDDARNAINCIISLIDTF
jgi:phosphocarrier protein HPr